MLSLKPHKDPTVFLESRRRSRLSSAHVFIRVVNVGTQVDHTYDKEHGVCVWPCARDSGGGGGGDGGIGGNVHWRRLREDLRAGAYARSLSSST